MVIPLFLVISLSLSQDFPAENKEQRFEACFTITQSKLSKDQETLDEFYKTFNNTKRISSRITADMLMKCYLSISLESAENILTQGKDFELLRDFEDLVDLDLSAYKENQIEYNRQHEAFFEEIKQIKNAEEKHNELLKKLIKSKPPMFNAGPAYIIGVVALFAAFLYWATNKVLKKPQKNKTSKGKKKN